MKLDSEMVQEVLRLQARLAALEEAARAVLATLWRTPRAGYLFVQVGKGPEFDQAAERLRSLLEGR